MSSKLDTYKALKIPVGNAICYSGFRDGQHPGGKTPSYDEIKDDLILLSHNWKYLRLYDCDLHSQRVLEVIKKEGLDLKVMLSAYIEAEVNNYNCPWGGGVYSEEVLHHNKLQNRTKIETIIRWAQAYDDEVFCLSVGNEACVDWTDHAVSVSSVVEYVSMVKDQSIKPVTFCENYVPWLDKLKPLGEIVDFISVHTYPVWEYKSIEEALGHTKNNYYSVANIYPEKPVIITEAGWATNSNGRGINIENVNEENQKVYYDCLMDWIIEEKIVTFVFEAFDEKWKGSPDPMEPEKHWGLFYSNRKPKVVMEDLYNEQLYSQEETDLVITQ